MCIDSEPFCFLHSFFSLENYKQQFTIWANKIFFIKEKIVGGPKFRFGNHFLFHLLSLFGFHFIFFFSSSSPAYAIWLQFMYFWPIFCSFRISFLSHQFVLDLSIFLSHHRQYRLAVVVLYHLNNIIFSLSLLCLFKHTHTYSSCDLFLYGDVYSFAWLQLPKHTSSFKCFAALLVYVSVVITTIKKHVLKVFLLWFYGT